jgi:isoleucyl-tRNA synthetase
VNPDFDYVKIEDIARKEVFIMAKCRLDDFYKSKDKTPKYTILDTFKGTALVGKSYVPIFDFFVERKKDGCFKILGANFVTSDAGTGVVHCAPGYG